MIKQIFGYYATNRLVVCENWLEVHWLPDRTRFDILCFQSETNRLAIGTKP